MGALSQKLSEAVAEMKVPTVPVFSDLVISNVTITLSWWDRVKVLLGAPVLVRVRVETEHKVGEIHATSWARTRPWNFWNRRHGMLQESSEKP